MPSKFIPTAPAPVAPRLPRRVPRLYMCTLFFDRGAHPEYYASLAAAGAAAASGHLDLEISRLGYGDNSLRQLTRRVAHFLSTGRDYFWLQGNDTDFSPDYIARMAAHGLPIVGGLFSVKQPELRWCYNPVPGAKVDPVTNLLEVQKTGLECMLIHRDVFCAWMKARPEDMYLSHFPDLATADNPDTDRPEWHFWQWVIREEPAGSGNRRLQSEDYFFCHTARELGFKIYADHSDYCGHWDHRTRYPLVPPGTARHTAEPPPPTPPA